jgi:uncharacterized membrane-anchored protein
MNIWIRQIAIALIAFITFGTFAQSISKEEAQKIWADAKAASQSGPTDIKLDTQAVLKLPAGQTYVPQPFANKVLNAMGNPGNDPRLQGIVFPEGNQNWFMTIRFETAGYVKDDDAKDWNADDLLKSYREGTEASNAERKKMGVPEMEILGWAEKPTYDSATHRLVWAMSSRDKGADASQEQGVNYNTYALGREGYFTMNLVTDLKDLTTFKPAAHGLLAAMTYNDGKKYADFNSSTDKVAEYGLAALVVGVAAKKLGFFAMIALFFAKFAKIAFLAVAAFGGVAFKFFKKKPADLTAQPQAVEPVESAHTPSTEVVATTVLGEAGKPPPPASSAPSQH